MRPQTDAEMARALRDRSHYAPDSETQWLMQAVAKRLDQIATLTDVGLAAAVAPASTAEPETDDVKPRRRPISKLKAAES